MKEPHFTSLPFYCTEELFYAILSCYENEKEENSLYLCV